MAITLSQPQQEQFNQLKKDQPEWSDEDVYGWGQKYYNWSSPVGGSAPSSPASGGGGGATLPPSAPPPTTITAPTSPLAPSPPPPNPMPGGMPGSNFTRGGIGPLPPPPADGGTGSGPTGTGAGDTVAETLPPRTIVINGQTYTIPGGIDLDSETTVGTAPGANRPDYTYAAEDPMLGLVREQLIALMGRANTPPDINDPILKPQADAYTAAQERARRGLQADTAESLSARGLGSSGAADSAMRGSYETMGQNIGEYNAGLVSEEQAARRGDLTSALGMANELGMFKEKNALERDLANIDTDTKYDLANLNAQLETAGLSVEERLGIMQNELRKYGLDIEGNLGLLKTVLDNEFNYAQLQVQTGIANLDSQVKVSLANLDAQLRREGVSAQERMAALDAEVRKHGIDTQGDLGNLEVALRRELGLGQLNLGLLNTLIGNQNFNDQLGWNMAEWAGNQNANWWD